MANITLQEMYDEWKKAANGIGTPSDSAQPDPTQAATIIAALKGQLERLGDLLEQMQGNGTGAMPVQLTGRNVVEVVAINALAINDTTTRFASVDLSAFRSVFIFAQSTLDKNVELSLYQNQSIANYYWDEETNTFVSGAVGTASIGVGLYYLNNHPAFKVFNGNGLRTLRIRHKCNDAPTTGSLTVTIWGVPN